MTLGSDVARIRNPSCRLAEHVKAGKTHQKSCGWELPETLVRLLDAPSASGVAKTKCFLETFRNPEQPASLWTLYGIRQRHPPSRRFLCENYRQVLDFVKTALPLAVPPR